jgi:hypothetical protein
MHEDDSKGGAVRMKPMEMPQRAHAAVPGLLLTMADVKKLPHVEMVTEFKCIEGWSEIVYWGGARMRDFLAAFPPLNGGRSQSDSKKPASGIPKYVGFETPDGRYYVGIEREVAPAPANHACLRAERPAFDTGPWCPSTFGYSAQVRYQTAQTDWPNHIHGHAAS